MRSSHGVTLVELLVVVAILGIVAVAAIPFLSSVDPQRLEAAARVYAEAIRFARSEALRTGTPYGYSVIPAEQRIRVFRADMGTSPPTPVYDVYDPVSKRLYDVSLQGDSTRGIDALASSPVYRATCNSSTDAVFDASGRPVCRNPYGVFLRQATLRLGRSGLDRVVTLDGVSGRVTVQ
ncbi:MAG: GspH/FimT family pseudopilin [Pseudomonadota bacterium]